MSRGSWHTKRAAAWHRLTTEHTQDALDVYIAVCVSQRLAGDMSAHELRIKTLAAKTVRLNT